MSLWAALTSIVALAAAWLLGSAPLIYLYVVLAGAAGFSALLALARHPGDRRARAALLLLAGGGVALALALSGGVHAGTLHSGNVLSGNAHSGTVPPG